MPKVNCLTCSRLFDKSPAESRRSPHHFCSRNCAAKYNNQKYPKRKREGKCECGALIARRRKYCDLCLSKSPTYAKSWAQITLAEIRGRARYQVHAQVRDLARRSFRRSGRPLQCNVCGYMKKVDVCHVKAIKDYPLTATIGEINAMSNLVALCPNHHWELDHGWMSDSDQNRITVALSC